MSAKDTPEDQEIEIVGQARVGSKHQITVPEQCQKILFKENDLDDGVYYWYVYHGSVYSFLYMADGTNREDNAETIDNSRTHSDHINRTTVPEDVRKKKDIEIGDNIYFLTHDKVGETPNPSVGVLTEDEIREILQEGFRSEGEDQLYRVFKDTTPTFNGPQNSPTQDSKISSENPVRVLYNGFFQF